MAQNQPQNRKNDPLQINEEIVKEFLVQQRLKLENESANSKIEGQRIASHEKLALKAIEYQARDNKAAPGQMRLTIVVISCIIFAFLVALMFVILYLINIGKEEFAYNILKAITYLVALAIGYFAGRRSKKTEQKQLDIQEAEVID